MSRFNKILFSFNAFIVAVILTITVVNAWTNPSANPPSGNNSTSTIYYSGANIGIGKSNPSSKLDINTASITEGLYLDGRAAVTGYDTDTWLRLNQSSSYASGIYTPGVFRADGAIVVDGNTVIDDGAGWHRSYGATGWQNATYGGGWYMTDTTYISVYGGKQILLGNHLNANNFKITNLAAPSDPNDGVRKVYIDSLAPNIPTGIIGMWSGTLASIPSGWQLCNGTNGTPNLTAKFVYGVSAGENPGTTGGTSSHNHELVPHNHYFSGDTDSCPYQTQVQGGVDIKSASNYHYHFFSGSSGDASSNTTDSVSHLPPYYKIAFICKL